MMPQPENIDRLEIAKFEAMAPRWWDPKGALKSLHDINPLRLGYIADRVRLADRRALDVGCVAVACSQRPWRWPALG